ncbi:hypothetical protein N657DRAFT_647024 [Parathielavia appendiculata]|uniref:Tyrosine specific protein phosphatases domain-containing protein n=1 Tax=Parathielavia appendiculata TaxID=2587402 RepID=A0AAN6TX09_9PEZI|nr:hypothetical protein N657DRAFT_647024 [Parathielavia appendiculata]
MSSQTAASADQDLLTLCQTDAFTPIPEATLHSIFSNPPFVPIPDTFNARDLGLLPGSPIRPGLIYRSGGFFRGLSPEGAATIAGKLGVKKMFDLRSVREHERQPDPNIDGVEGVWVKPGEEDAVVVLEDFLDGEGEKGYVAMYLDVLQVYRDGIRAVLEHVRDGRGEEGLLFHCTAGRDRTGVVAGLLLSLAGAGTETIVLDFMLSRVGIEPVKEQLLTFALHGSMAASPDAPGFRNLINLRISSWEAFVKAVETRYGGFRNYVTKTLGLSDEDVAQIRRNLVKQN